MVIRDSVATPEARAKILEAFEHSLALGTEGGRMRALGTRYHFADAYKEMEDRGTFKTRVHQAEKNGVPVLLSALELADHRRDMGPYTYSSQMMLDPKKGGNIGFQDEWWRVYHGSIMPGNRYAMFDPASSKKRGSDFTAGFVVEACADRNYYIRDIIHDRLSLTERVNMAMSVHREWRPRTIGWEEYALTADVEAIRAEQDRSGYRFDLVSLGGSLAKPERINRLVPLFEQGRIRFPPRLLRMVRASGREEDLVRVFQEQEFKGWPYVAHDDLLDALARIEDPAMGIVFPQPQDYRSGRSLEEFADAPQHHLA